MPGCSTSAPAPDADLCQRFALFLRRELEEAAGQEIPEPVVRVRVAERDGDLTTSAAARAARHLARPVDGIADCMAAALATHPQVQSVQHVGGGHLSWSLRDDALWRAMCAASAKLDGRGGQSGPRVAEATREDPVFAGLHVLSRCRAVAGAAESLLGIRALPDCPGMAPQPGELSTAERAVVRFIVLTACDRDRTALDRLAILARLFDALWNEERGPVTLRFLSPGDVRVTQRRLTLLQGVENVTVSWLGGLGVEGKGELS